MFRLTCTPWITNGLFTVMVEFVLPKGIGVGVEFVCVSGMVPPDGLSKRMSTPAFSLVYRASPFWAWISVGSRVRVYWPLTFWLGKPMRKVRGKLGFGSVPFGFGVTVNGPLMTCPCGPTIRRMAAGVNDCMSRSN